MVSTVFISLPTGPPTLVLEPSAVSSGGHEGPGITDVVLLEVVNALVDDVVALVDDAVALAEGVLALAEGGVALADGGVALAEVGVALAEDVLALVDGVVAPVEGVVALVDGVNASNTISKDCVHTDCLYVCVCVSVLVVCV